MRRNKIIFIWLAASILFMLLTINVLSQHVSSFNNYIYMHIEQWINPLLTQFMIIVSNISDWYTYSLIVFLILIIPQTRKKVGIPMTVAILITQTLNYYLKYIFNIQRPDINRLVSISGYSYPSGHVMNGTVFIGLCIFFIFKYSRNKVFKYIMTIIFISYLILVGINRIYLGVHYATDVLGGYLAGILILIPAIYYIRKTSK